MNWTEVASIAAGGVAVTFMGWIAKFVMRVDRRLTRIETILKLNDSE